MSPRLKYRSWIVSLRQVGDGERVSDATGNWGAISAPGADVFGDISELYPGTAIMTL
jgi:hypothetical protein